MRVVLRLAGHELRARWRAWAALALLVAVAGGAVLAAAAGARRTATAYPRFLRASHASDLLIAPALSGLPGFYPALARQPGVALVAPVVGLNVQPVGPGAELNLGAVTVAPLDGRFGHVLDIPKMLAGRLPRPGRPGEIAVDQIAAATLHLQVGSSLTMAALANGNPGSAASSAVPPRRLTERVVGILVTRSSVFPVTDNDKAPLIFASTALWHRLGPSYQAFQGAYLKLRPGATAGSVGREAQALARRYHTTTGGQVLVASQGTQVATIDRSIRPEAAALAIFALVLAGTALLIIGQAAARLLLAAASDNPVLAALGMTGRQLMAAGLAEVAVAGGAGAVLAAGVAVAASPLTPVGIARLAEPAPGISVDWPVLAAGAAAIVVLLLAGAAWPARRLATMRGTDGARAAARPVRPSRLAGWLAGMGAPVMVTAGTRLALEPGRGQTAVPVRAALAGTALSVLAVAAAFTFGANLLNLVSTPRLYGQSWDAAVDLQFQAMTAAQAQHWFGTNPGVTGWTFGDHGTVTINGAVIPAIGLARGRGPLISPTLLAGRPPRTSREIVLGTSTLRSLGLRVGQQVSVTVVQQRMRDRIVGSAVFPDFGQGGLTSTNLGEGAETTAAVLRPEVAAFASPHGFEVALLRFAPGPGREAAIARFQRSMSRFCATVQQLTCVLLRQRPNGVNDYAPIDGIPEVLAALLGGLGIALLAQLAVLSGRRRRRDFAILKTLGLRGRQVRAITAWQASLLAALALLIGLPLGVAAGRWSWQLFGNGLGVPADPRTPLLLVLLMVPAVLLIANLVAWWPGRSAARVRPAQVLRAE